MSWCSTHIDYMSNMAGVRWEARFAPGFCCSSFLFFLVLCCFFCLCHLSRIPNIMTLVCSKLRLSVLYYKAANGSPGYIYEGWHVTYEQNTCIVAASFQKEGRFGPIKLT